MKRFFFACLLAALASASAGRAADETDFGKLSKSEVVDRMVFARQAVALEPPREALLNSPLASHPMFNEIFATVDETKLNEAAATVMASTFTSQELKALVDFQNSPLGRKIRIKMPAYQKLLGATMQNYLSVAFHAYVARQGAGGASNIPINSTLGGGSPPASVHAPAAPAGPAAPATPGAPAGGGTPIQHK